MKRILTFIIIIFSISVSFSQVDNKSDNSQSSQNTATNFSNFTISVTIGGDFPITGTFPAYINERVDQFVTKMYLNARQIALNNINNPKETAAEINDKLNNFSLRGIILKRSNGEVLTLDLKKFRINGDFVNNPYLKNDDILIFPPNDLTRNYFSISGAVNSPGKFHYLDGDKLSDAIVLAQGINKAYKNVTNAEIDRLSYNGEKMETISVNINDNFPLERGDRIRILADETQKRDFKVTVIGEVKMPGEIPIKKDSSTLNEVIKKAGGFTAEADLNRAQLIRGANAFNSLIFSNQIEQLQMLRMSTLKYEDSIYFNIDEQLRLLRGNGNVDFTKLEDKNFSDTLFLLRDGDIIYIPPKIDLVYVYGQVNDPGYVKFEKNKDINFYINLAGGLGTTADNDIYLIKGKTRSWISEDDVKEKGIKIEPGDFIWVSKKSMHDFWYHLDQASRIASVLSGIATLIILVYQLKK
jgi:protein involved in polysaccharide export with SLBB domain